MPGLVDSFMLSLPTVVCRGQEFERLGGTMHTYDHYARTPVAPSPRRPSAELDSRADALRAMLDDVRRRPLTHEETQAVTDLLQTIRRLLPEDDL
jgi:hypothetical protein